MNSNEDAFANGIFVGLAAAAAIARRDGAPGIAEAIEQYGRDREAVYKSAAVLAAAILPEPNP